MLLLTLHTSAKGVPRVQGSAFWKAVGGGLEEAHRPCKAAWRPGKESIAQAVHMHTSHSA